MMPADGCIDRAFAGVRGTEIQVVGHVDPIRASHSTSLGDLQGAARKGPPIRPVELQT